MTADRSPAEKFFPIWTPENFKFSGVHRMRTRRWVAAAGIAPGMKTFVVCRKPLPTKVKQIKGTLQKCRTNLKER